MTYGNFEQLRVLRKWHYDSALRAREQAESVEKRVTSRTFDRAAREAFEKSAAHFHAKANEHLRFVQTLNDFFPPTDRVV